ncbi:MAG: caspase family protein [Microcoleaceae cyanobacterium]
MGLKRRTFLKQTSLILAALGISEAAWWQASDRYYQALASSTQRKLALLVGINQYPKKRGEFEPLQGCLTDVELQKELLIHRFGFQPQDVLTLTDGQATRAGIESAFLSHLVEQAGPKDVVVFHFSGYGCYLPRSTTPTEPATVQSALVPVDGTTSSQDSSLINNLSKETLWLLLRSLSTPNLITVLDTSYNYPGQTQQGMLRIRSSDAPTATQLSDGAVAFQTQLLKRLNYSPEQFQQRDSNQLPGTVLSAAKPEQIATEITRDGYTAGLFTYALTQSLWSIRPSANIKNYFSQVAGRVEQVMGAKQQPQLSQQITTPTENKPLTVEPINPLVASSPPAVGIIQQIEDNGNIQVMLTGLSETVLESYESNSLLTILPDADAPTPAFLPQLLIQSRNGFMAKTTLRNPRNDAAQMPLLAVGQRVQEAIRVLPSQVNLKVAIDPQLTRIERVDATSAFSGIDNVSIVKNEYSADYMLSKVRDTTIAQSPTAPLPKMVQGNYGLFSLGQALIPDSVGERGEAVKVAVQRLVPQLKTRLATKLLRLTVNQASTLLQVKATFARLTPQSQILLTQQTPQKATAESSNLLGNKQANQTKPEKSSLLATSAFVSAQSSPKSTQGMLSVTTGSRIQYQLQNNGNLPIYFLWFRFDSEGQASIFNPIVNAKLESDNTETRPQQKRVPVGKTVSLPTANLYDSSVSGEMTGELLQGPPGLIESYIILSHTPFTQTIQTIQQETQLSGRSAQLVSLPNPLAVAQAVLKDLNTASQLGVERAGISTEDIALDVNAWAGFNFIYRVV